MSSNYEPQGGDPVMFYRADKSQPEGERKHGRLISVLTGGASQGGGTCAKWRVDVCGEPVPRLVDENCLIQTVVSAPSPQHL